jgi:hypothetical protein
MRPAVPVAAWVNALRRCMRSSASAAISGRRDARRSVSREEGVSPSVADARVPSSSASRCHSAARTHRAAARRDPRRRARGGPTRLLCQVCGGRLACAFWSDVFVAPIPFDATLTVPWAGAAPRIAGKLHKSMNDSCAAHCDLPDGFTICGHNGSPARCQMSLTTSAGRRSRGTDLGLVADGCSVAFRVRLTVATDGRQLYWSAVVMSIVKRNVASPEGLGDQRSLQRRVRGI